MQEVYVDDSPMLDTQFFWNKVVKMYPKSRIALLDGLDSHDNSHFMTMRAASEKGVLFVKEIDDQMLYEW